MWTREPPPHEGWLISIASWPLSPVLQTIVRTKLTGVYMAIILPHDFITGVHRMPSATGAEIRHRRIRNVRVIAHNTGRTMSMYMYMYTTASPFLHTGRELWVVHHA